MQRQQDGIREQKETSILTAPMPFARLRKPSDLTTFYDTT